KLGKLAVTAARGLLRDGTPFNIPGGQPLPLALHIPDGTNDQKVYLALAATSSGMRAQDETGIAVDRTSTPAEFVLSLDSSVLPQSHGLPLVHVAEQRAGRIVLDDSYVPPCLDCRASAKLLGDVDQIAGMLTAKSDALSH